LEAFFVRSGHRRFESQAGLSHLGVPLHRQIYLGLTDGGLQGDEPQLDDALADILDAFQPDRTFTLGNDGYDGHADHIATHRSSVRVMRQLGSGGILHTLDSTHQGEITIAHSERKLGAMAWHASQLVSRDLSLWGGTDRYARLIMVEETYNRQDSRAA